MTMLSKILDYREYGRLVAEGDLRGAIEKLESLLATNRELLSPAQTSFVLLRIASTHCKLSQTEKAKEFALLSIGADPNSALARYEAARLLAFDAHDQKSAKQVVSSFVVKKDSFEGEDEKVQRHYIKKLEKLRGELGL